MSLSFLPVRRSLPLTVLASILLFCPAAAVADKATDDFSLGVGLWRKQRWELAADTFEQFLKDYPDHPRRPLATFYLGLSYSSLNKYDQSRQHFQDYLKLAPDSSNAAAARYRIGECSYYLGEYEAAAEQLYDYTQRHTEDRLFEWGLLQLGESLVKLERWPAASSVFEQLLEKTTEQNIIQQARYTMAVALERQGKPDEAVTAYRRVADDSASRTAGQALARAGTIRFRQKQYERAAAFYDQIVERFPTSRLAPAAAKNSGLALYRVKRYDEAVRRFDQVPADSPEKAEAVLLRGMALTRQQKFDDARRSLRQAYDLAAKKRDAELGAESLFEQARLEQLAGDPQAAVARYIELTDRWPRDQHADDALFNAAGLYLELKQNAQADAVLKRLQQEFPQSGQQARIRFLKGRVQLRSGQNQQAAETLKQVLEDESADPRSIALSLYYLARIQQQSQQYEAALATVRRLRPRLQQPENQDLAGALALGAMSALETGNLPDAEEMATAYLTQSPNGSLAADAYSARAVVRAQAAQYQQAQSDLDWLQEQAADQQQTWKAVLQCAEIAWQKEAFQAALPLFQRATHSQAPTGIQRSGTSGAAWCLMRLKQFDEAEQTFAKVVERWPDSSLGMDARFQRIRCLQEAGHTDNAILGLQELTQTLTRLLSSASPGEDQAQLREDLLSAGRQTARMLAGHDRWDEAHQQWDALASQFAGHESLASILDEWAAENLKRSQYATSDQIYRRLLQEHPDSRYAGTARLSLAESSLLAGETEEAFREFQAIVDHTSYQDSEKARALFHLADIQAEQKQWKAVDELCRTFATDYNGSELAARMQLLHADALLRLGQADEAERLLQLLRNSVLTTEKAAPTWIERVWIVLGEVALDQKNYTSVDEVSQEFFDRFPESRHRFQMDYLLGRRWIRQAMPDFVKARQHLEQVVYDETGRGSHTAARSQFLIAESFLMQEDYDKASREFHKVHVLYQYPDLRAQALYQAGACERQSARPELGTQTWQQLIQEFPQSQYARQAQQQLAEAG